MNQVDITNLEKALTNDELELIEAFVKSPIHRVWMRMLQIEKQKIFNFLMSSTDTTEMVRLQGKMMGINIAQVTPAMHTQTRISRKEAEQKKEAQ